MNFPILPILKKDFRLTWRYLVAWGALLLLKACCIIMVMNNLMNSSFWLIGLTYTSPILLAYITATVLKADSPIDERALWRMHPAAGRAVLRAKLLFLFLFGIAVPCAIAAAARAYYSLGAYEYLRGAVETALLQAAWIGVVASATLLFQKTINGLLVFASIALAGTFFSSEFDFPGDNFVFTPHPGWLGVGTGFIFTTLAVVTTLMVARKMYGGERQMRGVTMLGCGLVLAAGIALLCRGLFFSESTISYPRDNSLNLTLHTLPAGADPASLPKNATIKINVFNLADSGRSLYGSLATLTFPELQGKVLWVKRASVSLRWPDPKNQPIHDSTQEYYCDGDSLINASTALTAAGYGRLAAVGYGRSDWDPLQGTFFLRLFYLKNDLFNRAQNRTARWTGELSGEIGHFVVITDMPLKNGTGWKDGNIQYLFRDTDKHFFVYDKNIIIYLNGFGPDYYLLTPPSSSDNTPYLFLLYNPRTKECIKANSDSALAKDRATPFPSILFEAPAGMDFNFSNKLDENGQPFPNPMSDDEIQNWASESHLVVLRFEPDRPLSCTMTIDPFVVPQDNPADANPAATSQTMIHR